MNERDTALDEQIKNIALMIDAYLVQQGGAADTLEGVIKWWLAKQQYIEAEELVKQALCWLQKEGKLETKTLTDGTEIYFSPKGQGTKSDKRL